MSGYTSILVAVDVFNDVNAVIDRALRVCSQDTKIHVAYVVQPQHSIAPYGGYLERDFSEEVRVQAEKKLIQIAQSLPAKNTTIHTAVGSVADELHCLAKACSADLVILGAHSSSGVFRLLGSVANAVIQRSEIDVLTVKMH
ncbi:universal stress protein [Salinimonas chungwhensis]|uniref:universal stress protein n=1 Tax=Salinimonas chungwhensis TaxID=265425 RepID=UPI0003685F81|nr:universal stress protein [Salinimonas chungwhensis]